MNHHDLGVLLALPPKKECFVLGSGFLLPPSMFRV